MPHTRSAKKRLRQNATHQGRNKAVKTHLKTRVKKFDAAIAAGDVDEAKKQALLLQKSFDRAVTHGIIHKNRARRKNSITVSNLAALLKAKAAS